MPQLFDCATTFDAWFGAPLQALQTRRPAAAAAGAAGALLLAIAALGLTRPGRAALSALPPAVSAAVLRVTDGGGRAAAPQPLRAERLDERGAAALVRAWQAAKYAAMGPAYDGGGLPAVLAEPLLSQFAAKAGRFKEQGWFIRYKLWSSTVYRLTPGAAGRGGAAKGAAAAAAAAPSTYTVLATLEESASLYGVDGRQADSYQSVYDTEYVMGRCADGAWRISEARVIGREPDAAPSAMAGK